MRTIRFRGKSKNGGQWFYGNLYDKDVKGNTHIGTTSSGCLNIDPETVGQFTGLKDKDGCDIYEGDIIQSPANNIVVVEFGYKEHIVKHGRPQITDSFACYGWLARNVKNGITDFLDNEFLRGVVIGNIHDNPELCD